VICSIVRRHDAITSAYRTSAFSISSELRPALHIAMVAWRRISSDTSSKGSRSALCKRRHVDLAECAALAGQQRHPHEDIEHHGVLSADVTGDHYSEDL